jgi:hypothetical protein
VVENIQVESGHSSLPGLGVPNYTCYGSPDRAVRAPLPTVFTLARSSIVQCGVERLSSVKYGESGVAEQVVEMSGRQDIRSSVPYFQTNVALEIRCEPNRA